MRAKVESMQKQEITRLGQNESPYGPSPRVLGVLEEFRKEVHRYPMEGSGSLRSKLSEHLRLPQEQIAVFSGSVEAIALIINHLIKPGHNMVTASVSFVAYYLFARNYGVECRVSKMDNHRIDLRAMQNLCDAKTQAVFLANPNNPTGTMVDHAEVKHFLERMSRKAVFVLDEAYFEYVSDPTYPKALHLLEEFPNLIILRTFSKAYGLAGLRVGYAIARPEIISKIESARTPFSVNSMGYTAACSALQDQDYLKSCVDRNSQERDRVYHGLADLGFDVAPSQANFLFLHLRDVEDLDRICKVLDNSAIQVGKMGAYGDDLGLRITLGKPEENQVLLDCLSSCRNS
jgi:histidinol-phosphate aminotransferase